MFSAAGFKDGWGMKGFSCSGLLLLSVVGFLMGGVMAESPAESATLNDTGCDALAKRVVRGEVIARDQGIFAWYDLQDFQSGDTLFMRQAILGADKKNKAEGVWLETEIVPRVGFPVLYKVLIESTGDKAGRILDGQVREGYDPPRPLDLKNLDALPGGDLAGGQIEVVGAESVDTPSGPVNACHVKVIKPDGKNIELWVAENVTPTGIINMRTPEGEMKLRFFGKGGADGSSAMDRPPPFESSVTTKVTTESGTSVETPAPERPEDAKPPAEPGKARRNFNVKRGE